VIFNSKGDLDSRVYRLLTEGLVLVRYACGSGVLRTPPDLSGMRGAHAISRLISYLYCFWSCGVNIKYTFKLYSLIYLHFVLCNLIFEFYSYFLSNVNFLEFLY